MRIRETALYFLAGSCLWASGSSAGLLPDGDPLWLEPHDFGQLERSWSIHQNPFANGRMQIPVLSAGPTKLSTANPPNRSSLRSETTDSDIWIRFDLTAAGLSQFGLANGPFSDELAYTPQNLINPDQRLQFSAGFLARLSHRWTLWQQTFVDTDPTLDPASRTKEFHQIDSSVEIPTAVLAYEGDEMAFWLGRRWERWGPGWTGSLILEPGAPEADGFGYSWTRSRWSARYRCARLDDFTTDGPPLARYLAGHRLDVAVHPTLRIGLSETALVSSGAGMPL